MDADRISEIKYNETSHYKLTRDFLEKYYGGGVNYRGLMGLGPAAAVIDTLKRYEAAGVTDLCVRFAGADQVEQLERFTREVAPAFAGG